MLDGVNLSDFGISLQELLDLAGDETKLETFLEEHYENLSEDERGRSTFDTASLIESTLKDLKEQLKGKKEELRDEQRNQRYAERDSQRGPASAAYFSSQSTSSSSSYSYVDDSLLMELEDEIASLEQDIDALTDAGLGQKLEAELNQYNSYNIDMELGSEDLTLRDTYYDDGDVVKVNLLGGNPLEAKNDEWDFADLDGAGFSTYADYEAFVQQQSQAVGTSATQNAVITVSGVVKSMRSTSAGKNVSNLEIVTYDAATQKTVTYLFEGVKEGTAIFITGSNPNYLPDALLKAQNPVVQKALHRGMTQFSAWNELNKPTDEEKLSYVKFYDEVSSKEGFDQVGDLFNDPQGTLSSAAAYEAYKETIDILFAEMNAHDAGEMQTQSVLSDEGIKNHLASSAWTKALSGPLAGLTGADKANVIKNVVMALATETDPAYFEAFMNDTNAVTMIEDVLNYSDTGLTKEGRALVMFLEMHAENGKFSTGTDGSFIEAINTFMLNPDDVTDTLNKGYFEDAWQDKFITLEAFDLYTEMVNKISWATVSGSIEGIKEALDEEVLNEKAGFSDYAQKAWGADLQATISKVDKTDAKNSGDTIDMGPYADAVTGGLQTMITAINQEGGISTEDLGNVIINYLNSGVVKLDQQPMVAAGLIKYIQMANEDLFKSLCLNDAWMSSMRSILNEYDGNGRDVMTRANALLDDAEIYIRFVRENRNIPTGFVWSYS